MRVAGVRLEGAMSAATIREIVRWLRTVEHLANEVYLQGAAEFAADARFADFLEHLAEDEAWHFHVMGSAADHLTAAPQPKVAISVDPGTAERILGQLRAIQDRLSSHSIQREELIDRITELELSEWNDIFLYVVNVMKERASEFKYPAARIQAHITEIELFLKEVGSSPGAMVRLKELPPVWVENILIVDDERPITQLLRRLLSKLGNVEVAHDGSAALEVMATKYYKVVISDIDMPVMDGLAFFEEAARRYPSAGTRFLFITGNPSPERIRLLVARELSYLAKPMAIDELQRIVGRMIVAK
jgi:CheY-like chemotaxis protein